MRRDLVTPVGRIPASEWTGVAVEYGAVGVALLAIPLALLLIRGVRHAPRERSFEFLSSLSLLVASSVFNPVLSWPATGAWAAIVLGGLANGAHAGDGARGVPADLNRSDPWLRRSRGAVFAIMLVGTVLAARRLVGTLAMARHPGPAGARTAVRVDPGAYEARVILANDWARAGRCAEAASTIAEARALMPHAEAPRSLEAFCARAGQPRDAARAPVGVR